MGREMSHAYDVRTPRGVTLTDTALTITRPIGQEEFERLLATLVHVEQCAPWWVGDAIVYSGRRWGERYRDAAKATGKSIGTLRNYASVARRVQPEDRDPSLPYRTHTLVAARPAIEQRRWLTRAAKFGLTSTQLADEMRAADRAAAPTAGDFVKPSIETEYCCPKCGYEWSGNPRGRRRSA